MHVITPVILITFRTRNKNMNESRDSGIPICCQTCGYAWKYMGKFQYYATCPSCRRNIKIKNAKANLLQSAGLGGLD